MRPIAFYLPQFHPIPENDAWWGKGFTEWTNVVRSKPLFSWHYQPRLPGELGFYDLRLNEVLQAQAALAAEHGIHGFCFYHYWFNGHLLLERPLEQMLSTGMPQFPFCLCWANENWTRRWDGMEAEVLMRQNYSEEDDRNHIRYMAKFMSDSRYIRVGGRPLLLIYRASLLPNPGATVGVWRSEARRLGLGELYLCCVESSLEERGLATRGGFDAAVEFAPDWSVLPKAAFRSNLFGRLLARLRLINRNYAEHRVVEYHGMVANMLRKAVPDYLRYPCVTPSFDNSARRKSSACILRGATPESYGEWLSTVVKRFRPLSKDENFIFINAWNEWAEGNHLEPCGRWGRAYLEATKKALRLETNSPSPEIANDAKSPIQTALADKKKP